MNSNLKSCIDNLREALKEDKNSPYSYYYSWQANIASAFELEFNKNFLDAERLNPSINSIANQAAKNFLNLLISDNHS